MMKGISATYKRVTVLGIVSIVFSVAMMIASGYNAGAQGYGGYGGGSVGGDTGVIDWPGVTPPVVSPVVVKGERSIGAQQSSLSNGIATAAYNGNPSLEYFGYFGVQCDSTVNEIPDAAEIGANIAFLFISGNKATYQSCLQSAKDNNMKVEIQPWFFVFNCLERDADNNCQSYQLYPDYLDKLNTLGTYIAGYEDVIYAFHFDEPAWRGISQSDFRAVTHKLRTTYPNIGISTYEPSPILDGAPSGFGSKPPPSKSYYEFVTDLGLDWYGCHSSCANFDTWNIDEYRNYYGKLISKFYWDGQKIWLVPQTFTEFPASVNLARLESILNDYYSFAQNDRRVVGIMGFLYKTSGDMHGINELFNPASTLYSKPGAASYRNLNKQLAKSIAHPETSADVMLSRNVSVTSSGSYLNFTPQLAVDGNLGTRWNSGGFAPQSITLNLGKPQTVSTIRMLTNQSTNGTTDNRIYVKKNASDAYTHVKSFKMVTFDNNWITYVPGLPLNDVQYIKISSIESPSWIAWREIEAYGPDVAPPLISNIIPTGTISTSEITVGADFLDTGSGINTSSLVVSLDGNVLTDCLITTNNFRCAVSGIANGNHTIGGTVADNAGNSTAINGNFDVVLPNSKKYYWAWYDNVTAQNWVLMANPSSSPTNASFSLDVAGANQTLGSLPGLSVGVAPAGGVLFNRFPGLAGGPVTVGAS
ncbi:MAG: discoidin domain-containing protein, partial [Thermoleophilia bacterium]